MKSYFQLPENRPNRDREAKAILQALGLVGLMLASTHASALTFSFPIVDDVLCGFLAYSRNMLAPVLAALVILFAVVGHWLGMGKMWGTMLNMGIGLGVILGIGSMVARVPGVGASCLA